MSKPRNLPFEWLVGLRYTRGGRRSQRNGFLSFISLVSIVGITLGVAVLIVVTSVINGFQTEVRDRMLSVLAHVEIADLDSRMPWRQLADRALQVDGVVAAAPFSEVNGMMIRGETMRPVLVRGVLPALERTVSDLARQVRSGSLDALRPGSGNVLLGRELAAALHAKTGDQVTLALPSGGGAAGVAAPRLRRFTVAGLVDAGHFEFDSTLAYVHIDDAAERLEYRGPVAVRLKTRDLSRAPEYAAALRRHLPAGIFVRDWTRVNATWFAAVQSQKVMLSIVVMMIMAVAAFNLVSTLVLTVTDKRAEIAILRTLGASPRAIMKIFLVQGVLVGLLGTVSGIVLGVLAASQIGAFVAGIEHLFGIQLIAKDVYLISRLPSEIRYGDIAVVACAAMLLALLSTLYPSWTAARVNAADALRHE
jgi:lipoprotein-releasing system permease protein